jgi:hypothetical protein
VDTEKPLVDRRFFLHKTGSNMDSTVEAVGIIVPFPEMVLGNLYLGRFPIWAKMELMMYVFDGGEV